MWFAWFIIKILDRVNRWVANWRLKLNENIRVGESVRIHPSVRIDTRFGGSIKIGNGTKIWDNVLIYTYGGNIEIGDNCDINPYTIIYGHGGTKIGNNVLIAGHCMIIPNAHNFNDPEVFINKQGSTSKGIVIEDNVWIAHSCSILDGVTVKSGSVIAAGSVVNKNVEAGALYAGVPAKKLKYINEKK